MYDFAAAEAAAARRPRHHRGGPRGQDALAGRRPAAGTRRSRRPQRQPLPLGRPHPGRGDRPHPAARRAVQRDRLGQPHRRRDPRGEEVRRLVLPRHHRRRVAAEDEVPHGPEHLPARGAGRAARPEAAERHARAAAVRHRAAGAVPRTSAGRGRRSSCGSTATTRSTGRSSGSSSTRRSPASRGSAERVQQDPERSCSRGSSSAASGTSPGRGFRLGKKIRWDVEVLEELFELLAETAPEGQILWNNKQVVPLYVPEQKEPWAAVQTKKIDAVYLPLTGPKGRFTLGRIAALGYDPQLDGDRDARPGAAEVPLDRRSGPGRSTGFPRRTPRRSSDRRPVGSSLFFQRQHFGRVEQPVVLRLRQADDQQLLLQLAVLLVGQEVVAEAAGSLGQAGEHEHGARREVGLEGHVVEHFSRAAGIQAEDALLAHPALPRLAVVDFGRQLQPHAAVGQRKGLDGQQALGLGEYLAADVAGVAHQQGQFVVHARGHHFRTAAGAQLQVPHLHARLRLEVRQVHLLFEMHLGLGVELQELREFHGHLAADQPHAEPVGQQPLTQLGREPLLVNLLPERRVGLRVAEGDAGKEDLQHATVRRHPRRRQGRAGLPLRRQTAAKCQQCQQRQQASGGKTGHSGSGCRNAEKGRPRRDRGEYLPPGSVSMRVGTSAAAPRDPA